MTSYPSNDRTPNWVKRTKIGLTLAGCLLGIYLIMELVQEDKLRSKQRFEIFQVIDSNGLHHTVKGADTNTVEKIGEIILFCENEKGDNENGLEYIQCEKEGAVKAQIQERVIKNGHGEVISVSE